MNRGNPGIMSAKVILETPEAPKPVGPYSQAVKVHNFLFLAGQVGIDPKTNQFVGPDVESQARQAMKNVERVLYFGSSSLSQVVRMVVYLADLGDMKIVNQIFSENFPFEPPARTTIQAGALPLGARIELEATAILPPPEELG